MIAELQTAVSKAPGRRARLKDLTNVEAVKLKVERAALLFRGAPVAVAISAVNALIVAAVTWSDFDNNMLLFWVAAAVSFALIRLAIWGRYKIAGASGRNMSRFARVHIVLMAINGAIWGVLAPIFAANGLITHPLLPFVIAGTAAGAIVSAGSSWRAVLAFSVPALTPLAVVYALMAGADGFAIAGVVFLYGVATTYLAVMTQRMVDRSILLHTKNTKLFNALQKKVDDAHEAEQRYRALVESTLDLTIIFSPEGRVTYASPAAHAVFGVEAESLIGATTKSLVHPDDISHFRSVGEKSLAKIGEVAKLPHVCMRAPGHETYKALGGRLTNMLYVPGVEGFVFNGGLLDESEYAHVHAAE
ncbi:MAG: PAS domain S-box protein [Marinicaulis sp.]|nr:PAS domain S-box protein [Marinicaulis sp.]NNE40702.1 PAS domain S-box protein [Marinicaulis sp.]NNL87684.1 PAS domain S-box protein [Marinicaulis sp.]